MTNGERALIERVAAGDRAALEELLRDHLPRLKVWIRLRQGRVLSAQESASDVAQSICRDLLLNLGQFRYPGEGAFRAWLYATAARKIADRAEYWRAARRDPDRLMPSVADESEATQEAGAIEAFRSVCSPSEAAIGAETMAAIERAFARLSEPNREIVLLSRLAGLSHAEIGERLEIPPATARVRLFRALGALAEELRREGIAGA